MKQSVKQMLQMLPEYCLVGLITFGAMVTGVHLHTCSQIADADTNPNAVCAIACHDTQTLHCAMTVMTAMTGSMCIVH